MTIRFSPLPSFTRLAEDALILPLFQGEKDVPFVFPKNIRTVIDAVRASKEFAGVHGETHFLSFSLGTRIRRVCLLGLGDRSDLTREEYRRAIGAGVTRLKKANVRTGALVMREGIVKGATAQELFYGAALGAALAAYHFVHATKKSRDPLPLRSITLLGLPQAKKAAVSAIREAGIVAEAIAFVKDTGNTPPNVLIPARLAEQTVDAAKGINGLTVKILNKKEIEKEKMGGLLGVAQGSQHEPRLIILEYKGKTDRKPIALVGKAITFDSGGISIKPAMKMDEMKFDMAGGAAVIATLIAAARLQLPVHLVGVICAAENMPSHNAFKPGDILTMGDETTVEVLNTDAEGRIVVADGLIYARRYKPETIITIATLTGAIVVALGDYATGLFTDDTEFARTLTDAGEKSGERVWHMPMPKKWGELLKGTIADLRNVPVARLADGSLGALFIHAFAEKGVHFAHLDIGGTGWQSSAVPYEGPGATGVGVRLFIEYLRSITS